MSESEIEKTNIAAAENVNVEDDKRKVKVRRVQKRKEPGHGGKRDRQRPQREFDRKIVSIRRVTRVYEGGKRMRLSVCVVAGDKNGTIGIGLGKGLDVKAAEEKAYNAAIKNLTKIPLRNNTIPHEIMLKKGASKIFMKPAAPGTGIVAGSSLRSVLEVLGVKDILTKIMGTNNPINNAYTAVEALRMLKQYTKVNSR